MKESDNLATASSCFGMGVGAVLFFGLGITQWLAIYAWVDTTFQLPWGITEALTALVGFLPIIGNICGTVGAINAWGWPWWAAVLLFFGSWIFYFFISLIVAGISSIGGGGSSSKNYSEL